MILKCNKCGSEMKYFESGCTDINIMYICQCGNIANKNILFDNPVFAFTNLKNEQIK